MLAPPIETLYTGVVTAPQLSGLNRASPICTSSHFGIFCLTQEVKMHSERPPNPAELEHAWKVNSYLNVYIRAANASAAILFALITFLSGTLLRQLPPLPPWLFAHFSTISATLGVLLALTSLFLTLTVIYPRVKPRESARGTIFWEHIAEHHSFESYSNALAKRPPSDEVTRQNYELARVARAKYRRLRLAILAATISTIYLYILSFLVPLYL